MRQFSKEIKKILLQEVIRCCWKTSFNAMHANSNKDLTVLVFNAGYLHGIINNLPINECLKEQNIQNNSKLIFFL